MSVNKRIRNAVVIIAIILAAAGAFFWRIISGLIPDRLVRAPDPSQRQPGGPLGDAPRPTVKTLYAGPTRIKVNLAGAPRSFARSPSGTVWISGGAEIVEMSADGAERGRMSLPAPASAIAFDINEELYVAMSNRIEVRDIRGAVLRSFADLDANARIVSIAADPAADELFLADAGNAVVLRYTKAGRLLGRIGEKDERRGIPGFVVPSPYFSIAVSADHRLYAANPGRHGIEIYSYDGSLVGSFYKPSLGIDGFAGCCNPACIALLDGGRILTVEKGIKRIKILSPSGEVLEVVADEESLEANFLGDGAMVGFDGRLLVLDRAAREILVFEGKKA